jgi:hypothetical protein
VVAVLVILAITGFGYLLGLSSYGSGEPGPEGRARTLSGPDGKVGEAWPSRRARGVPDAVPHSAAIALAAMGLPESCRFFWPRCK